MSSVDNMDLLEKELQKIAELSKQKKLQILQLKEENKVEKIDYNEAIKKYKLITNQIIDQEKLAEETHKKISKLNFKFQKIKANINEKYYKHLLDISNASHFQTVFSLFINMCFLLPKASFQQNILELRNEKEIKDLLEYLQKVYNELYQNNRQLFNQNLEIFNEFKSNNSQLINEYPFDTFFEYFENIFNIIELISQQDQLHSIIEGNTNEKNEIFLLLKSMERKIQKNDNFLKTNISFIKAGKKLYENYILIKSKDKKEEADLEAKNLYNTIQKLKNFYFDTCFKFDNMSSLSIQSEYTYSENISLKSIQTLQTDFNTNQSLNQEQNKTGVNFQKAKIEDTKVSSEIKEKSMIKNNEVDNLKNKYVLRNGNKHSKTGEKILPNESTNLNTETEFENCPKIKSSLPFCSEKDFKDSICDENFSPAEFRNYNKNFEIGKDQRMVTNPRPVRGGKANITHILNYEKEVNGGDCCSACV